MQIEFKQLKFETLSDSFPCYLYSPILDSATKRVVYSWHAPLLQNRHRLKHLLNFFQCFVKVLSHGYSVTHPSKDFSVFRLSFKFYSGRMKTNTQRYPMFAILAPSPTQCVALRILLCKELLVVFLSSGRRAGPAGILFWRKALCKAPFPGK